MKKQKAKREKCVACGKRYAENNMFPVFEPGLTLTNFDPAKIKYLCGNCFALASLIRK